MPNLRVARDGRVDGATTAGVKPAASMAMSPAIVVPPGEVTWSRS